MLLPLLLLALTIRSCAAFPEPTHAQFSWLNDSDIGFLIHYNIATYLPRKYDGCNIIHSVVPDINLFNPNNLNTDDWVETMKGAGASYAMLVVKHNCGFTTWPTQVVFNTSDQIPMSYNYSISHSPKAGVDLFGDFVRSCHKANMKTGAYYSIVWNNWLNVQGSEVQDGPLAPGQISINQSTYEDIVEQQLEELWSQYGPLHEIWFDGGYPSSLKTRLSALLEKYQPGASVFQGFGMTKNSIRNSQNEFGYSPEDTWLTVDSNGNEDENGAFFSPSECPTTLQQSDRWFYGGEDFPMRSVNELINAYHTSVGRNCKLVLDLAVSDSGTVDPRHAAVYRQFGNFLRECYGKPISQNFTCTDSGCILTLPSVQRVDRVVLGEQILDSVGSTIHDWSLDAQVVWGDCVDCWLSVPPGNGRSIGFKRIVLFGEAINVRALRLNALNLPKLTRFEAFLCQHA